MYFIYFQNQWTGVYKEIWDELLSYLFLKTIAGIIYMPTGNILLLKFSFLITFEKKPCALKLHFTSKPCRLIFLLKLVQISFIKLKCTCTETIVEVRLYGESNWTLSTVGNIVLMLSLSIMKVLENFFLQESSSQACMCKVPDVSPISSDPQPSRAHAT